MRTHALALLFCQTFLCAGFCQSFNSAEITKKITPAVVLVTGLTNDGRVLGSGFVLSGDGKIATNLHVIQDLLSGGVQLASGEKFDLVSVLAFDERKDIAIVKIAGFDLPSVTLGNSNSVQVGEPVLTMGSPLGLQGSVTTGVVSSIRDDPFGGGFKMIQTDASVNPGNSGGPLVNQKAEVVGIIRYKIGGTENLDFAVPVNYLRGLMDGPLAPMTLEELRAKLAKKTDVFQQTPVCDSGWAPVANGGCERASTTAAKPRVGRFGIALTDYDVAPKETYKIEPLYTQEAFDAKLQGKVIVSLIVGTNGIPTNIVVQQSLGGGLDEASVEAAARCRFTPGSKDAKLMPVNGLLEFNFALLPPKHPKLRKALAIGVTAYLAYVCPQVRKRPMLLLNTNEEQLLQSCKAAGF